MVCQANKPNFLKPNKYYALKKLEKPFQVAHLDLFYLSKVKKSPYRAIM